MNRIADVAHCHGAVAVLGVKGIIKVNEIISIGIQGDLSVHGLDLIKDIIVFIRIDQTTDHRRYSIVRTHQTKKERELCDKNNKSLFTE